MQNTLWCPWVLILYMLLSTTAQAVNHGHESAAGTSCALVDGSPQLSCAKSVTTRFDHSGRLWLAWFYSGHVYIQYSDNLAQILSKPVRVNADPEKVDDSGEDRLKLAFGNLGEIYIVWTERLPKRYTGNIRFTRSTDGGRSFFKPVTVNDDQAITGHRFAAMDTNRAGDIYIVWLDKRDLDQAQANHQEYTGSALYFSRSTNQGVSFHPNRKLVDHSCECCRTSIAVSSDDLPVVLWRHVYAGMSRDHALSKFQKPDLPGPAVRVSHDEWHIESCPHHGPALALDEADNSHVVWFTEGEARRGLFYAKMNPRSQVFTAPVAFGDPDRSIHPHVISVGKEVHMIWTAFEDDRMRLYLKSSRDGGDSWAGEHILAETDGPSDHAFLIKQGDRIYASWHVRQNGYRLIPVR